MASARLRWHRDGHDIVQCRGCSLLFRRDPPAAESLPEIYSPAYFRDAGELGGTGYRDYLADAGQHRANAARRLDELERLNDRGRLFDVGCAAGYFLDEARSRGWSVTGIDVSDSMVAHARDELGLDVRPGPLTPEALEPGGFDCVTMWDYIEHSIEPLEDLRAVHGALRPAGLLALTTGDAGSLVARVSGRRWHLLTPRHHNFFFTRRTMLASLEAAGFAVVQARHEASRYALSYLVHKLRTMVDAHLMDRFAERLAATRLGRVGLPVNLFDTMLVIARRP